MLKQERKLLNLIRKNFNLDSLIYFDEENNCLCEDNITVALKSDESAHIIRFLADQGYLELADHPLQIYFTLTYEGYHRYRILMDNIRIFFFTKWIPGFISGILSALAIEWLIRSFL
ncbi:MAG: hypothetical protein NC432_08650 [Roseburia sp.]|nr:hypothetical protein [Roseburia sp.]MCM1097818.1 hypothetical protein [Ruminococcus flavefaciens]